MELKWKHRASGSLAARTRNEQALGGGPQVGYNTNKGEGQAVFIPSVQNILA